VPEWLLWFTRFENSKVVALLLFFFTFCGILIYVYTGGRRSARLESYKHIPFQDEGHAGAGNTEVEDHERKESQ
jgi:cbb3-type cytochrome oxidase subunit 3